mgnify:FL=1
MAERSMEVDPAHLHAGATRCHEAAETALSAAGELGGKKPTAGMFGDFDEAHAFHQALTTAHQGHVEQLQGHHSALTDIGDKSRSGAHTFTAAEASNAETLRAAQAQI